MSPPRGGHRARPTVRFERKDTEQYHVCLGAPGIARDDERRFALRVLDNILGGTSSSRLFQEVRERRGLAYAVYSFLNQYAGMGQIGLYLGTRADNLAEALQVVGAELERLADEPARPRSSIAPRRTSRDGVVLSLESTAARMNRLGSSVLTDVPVLARGRGDRTDRRGEARRPARAGDRAVADRALLGRGIGVDEDTFRAAIEPLGLGAELEAAPA